MRVLARNGRFAQYHSQGLLLARRRAGPAKDPLMGYRCDTPLASTGYTPAPSEKWPDAVAPANTFRGQISPARRDRPPRR